MPEAIGSTKVQLGRNYRRLSRKLGLALMPSSPLEYLNRFASALDLPQTTITAAREFLEQIIDLPRFKSSAPLGLVAASLYMAGRITDHPRPQSDISQVVGVSEVTLRNKYRLIADELVLDLGV